MSSQLQEKSHMFTQAWVNVHERNKGFKYSQRSNLSIKGLSARVLLYGMVCWDGNANRATAGHGPPQDQVQAAESCDAAWS
jgi:hypothetical protein